MSIEDDLENLLGHINLGSTPSPAMMQNLIRVYELNLLKQLRSKIDSKIAELSGGAKSTGQFGDLNPFTVLGVSMDASEDEVRKAYRKRASKAHPDRGGTDIEMAKVNAAIEVICKLRGWSI